MIIQFRGTLINTDEIALVNIDKDVERGNYFDSRDDKDIFILKVQLRNCPGVNFLFYRQKEAEKAFDELAGLIRGMYE